MQRWYGFRCVWQWWMEVLFIFIGLWCSDVVVVCGLLWFDGGS